MNIIITSDNLSRSLTLNLYGWRAPVAILLLITVFATIIYRSAISFAEQWVAQSDPRVQHLIDANLARATAERSELWQNTISRLDQEVTNLQIKLWRINNLGNEIARRIGLPEDRVVSPNDLPTYIPPLQSKRSDEEEVSILDSLLFDMGAKFDTALARLSQIGANTSIVAMRRATVPMREPIEKPFWRTSSFGIRTDPFTGRKAFHSGYDYAAKRNTPVLAGADGIVTYQGRLGSYGKTIEIYHGDEISTLYGHLNDYRVEYGDFVIRNQVIGLVGSTGRSSGPHLHYEVRDAGRSKSYTKLIKKILDRHPLAAISPPADLLL